MKDNEAKMRVPPWYVVRGLITSTGICVSAVHWYNYETGEKHDEPIVEIGGKANQWPACIGPSVSGAPQLFREDVVATVGSSGLSGASYQSVTIGDIRSKALRKLQAPRYFAVHPVAELAMILAVFVQDSEGAKFRKLYEKPYTEESSKEATDLRLSKTHHRVMAERGPLDSARGESDFFVYDPTPSCGVGCSYRFIELARDKEWENIEVCPCFSYPLPPPATIESLPWPPNEEWFSPLQNLTDILDATFDESQ